MEGLYTRLFKLEIPQFLSTVSCKTSAFKHCLALKLIPDILEMCGEKF
jgi:hypothetical protein